MSGKRLGFVTPSIYAAFLRERYTTAGARYFRDIVKGGTGNSIAPGDTVGPGYDRVTGIGAVLFDTTGPLLHP